MTSRYFCPEGCLFGVITLEIWMLLSPWQPLKSDKQVFCRIKATQSFLLSHKILSISYGSVEAKRWWVEEQGERKPTKDLRPMTAVRYFKILKILHDDDLGFQYFLYSSFHFKSNHVSTPFQSCKAYTPPNFSIVKTLNR